MKKFENSVPNIWRAQENLIHFYRVLSIGLGIALLVTIIIGTSVYFRDPVVIVKSSVGHEYFPGVREKVEIDKSNIEEFTKAYLSSLYVWPEFSTERLAREISPFSEEALVPKLVSAQEQKYGNDLKSKKLAQAITFVEVEVLEDRVVARFDRVLKIEGIPLVIPTEVTLSMIKGVASRLNPMGIFVSGITEHEGAN